MSSLNKGPAPLLWAYGPYIGLAVFLLHVVLFAGTMKSDAVQLGYRGTGMQQLILKSKTAPVVPDVLPGVEAGDMLAKDMYENVMVLGHLKGEDFNRLMEQITAWVSPEAGGYTGCFYCHTENLAEEAPYTKIVSRRMIEMVQYINSEWGEQHVQPSGVTCYTCHRGNPIPANIWYEEDVVARTGLGNDQGQNKVGIGFTAMPRDVFQPYLVETKNIRVEGDTALPKKDVVGATMQDTEATYSLMMHISEGLGVNCTYCHNTQSVREWSLSTPARVQAFHGITMVQALNNDFLNPLQPEYPAERLGPNGDAPKANCATCHNGENIPLGGKDLLSTYPALQASAM